MTAAEVDQAVDKVPEWPKELKGARVTQARLRKHIQAVLQRRDEYHAGVQAVQAGFTLRWLVYGKNGPVSIYLVTKTEDGKQKTFSSQVMNHRREYCDPSKRLAQGVRARQQAAPADTRRQGPGQLAVVHVRVETDLSRVPEIVPALNALGPASIHNIEL